MKKLLLAFTLIFALSLAGSGLSAQTGKSGTSATIVLNADLGKEVISRDIYGHFSEHLGHCIYGGYYVGEDSDIPNTRGIRNDVVEALKKSGIALPMNTTGWTASGRRTSGPR